MSSNSSEEQFLDKVAKRIASLRKAKSMTQERLAADADIDRVVLANIETGLRRPTTRTIYKIARGLNVKPDEIFKNL